ncbi:hypothetical protein V6N11_063208 [Hibiscus sabdariffa]|uniref:Uncharacterized protein n=1 Tax=Hibiscus sabdariffa TaxID=183260 RepID=A0ABR2NWN1_9ROSI
MDSSTTTSLEAFTSPSSASAQVGLVCSSSHPEKVDNPSVDAMPYNHWHSSVEAYLEHPLQSDVHFYNQPSPFSKRLPCSSPIS